MEVYYESDKNYTIEFSPIPYKVGSEQWKLTLKDTEFLYMTT